MRARLGRNVAANMVNAGASIGASLVSLPFILHHVGTAGYGVWTIALTFILYLTGAEAGFGPAAQRWVAVSLGRGARETVRHVLWTSVAIYTVVGAVVLVVMVVAGSSIAGLFDMPAALRDDATQMFHVVGVVLLVTLIAAALGNVLMGLERTAASAFAAGAGSLAYLIAVVVLVPGPKPLLAIAYAALIQQGVTVVGRAWALTDVIFAGRPALLRGREWRELLLFSAKLQLVVLAWLLNTQSDKIVVGLVATTKTVGQLGIGSQFADAGRLVASAALVPIMASLAVLAGREARDARDALVGHYRWVSGLWIRAIQGGTLIGAAALYPLIRAWLGGGHREAALLGSFLVLSTGVSLMSGVAVGYMRAIGSPGLEARYGFVVIALNAAATIPLAIVAGARGVVAGTLFAYALGTVWFYRRFSLQGPNVPLVERHDLARALPLAVAAAVLTGVVGTLAVSALPVGVALIPLALVIVLAYGAYLASITGTPLRPAAIAQLLRTLVSAPPPESPHESAPAVEQRPA